MSGHLQSIVGRAEVAQAALIARSAQISAVSVNGRCLTDHFDEDHCGVVYLNDFAVPVGFVRPR
jgi:hypothetical protein